MRHYHYVGFFPDPGELWEKTDIIRSFKLSNTIMIPHITTAYEPETVIESLFGELVQITAVGYGCDGNNEGLQVLIESKSTVIKEMIKQIPVPHITLSISDDAKAVNTRYLTFEPIPHITFSGKYGGVTEEEDLFLSSDTEK